MGMAGSCYPPSQKLPASCPAAYGVAGWMKRSLRRMAPHGSGGSDSAKALLDKQSEAALKAIGSAAASTRTKVGVAWIPGDCPWAFLLRSCSHPWPGSDLHSGVPPMPGGLYPAKTFLPMPPKRWISTLQVLKQPWSFRNKNYPDYRHCRG